MKSWGFFRGWGRQLEQSELDQALKRTGYRHVKLDAATHTLRFDEEGIELDLGAIGKGYTVDRVVEILRAEGVTSALVSSGTSSIYAIGAPPGEQGWEISVCDPFDRRKQACSLRLQNMSISISGSYEKSFVLDGKPYTHLLDPRNGKPVENMLMTVVIAASNAASDALSTAFFVSGVEQAQGYLQNHHNLTAIFYVPKGSSRSVEQIVLKSIVTALPANSFVWS
jgi:thiamine biosynthesis lipoprotein